MVDHLLPRAPVDEGKDLSGGYLERLKKVLKKARAVVANENKHRISELYLNIDIENAMRRANISSNAFAEDLLEGKDIDLPKEWADEIRRCLEAYTANPEAAIKAGQERYQAVLNKIDQSKNPLTSSIDRLRNVLAQSKDGDWSRDEIFEQPSDDDKEYVKDMQKGGEHAKSMEWQVPKHHKAFDMGLIDTFVLIDRMVTIFGPQLEAVRSRLPTVKSLDKDTVDKANEYIALEKAEMASLLQDFEKAILPAAKQIVERHNKAA